MTSFHPKKKVEWKHLWKGFSKGKNTLNGKLFPCKEEDSSSQSILKIKKIFLIRIIWHIKWNQTYFK